MKNILKDDLRGKFIYLKMDAVRRHRVNYFAINAKFINKDEAIVTKTLTVKYTQAHLDSHHLQKLIEGVLKDFEMKKEQILCIVTDNASNMIKTIQKLNESEEEEFPYEALDDVAEEASKFCQIKNALCSPYIAACHFSLKMD